jgi:hypothetical protein
MMNGRGADGDGNGSSFVEFAVSDTGMDWTVGRQRVGSRPTMPLGRSR